MNGSQVPQRIYEKSGEQELEGPGKAKSSHDLATRIISLGHAQWCKDNGHSVSPPLYQEALQSMLLDTSLCNCSHEQSPVTLVFVSVPKDPLEFQYLTTSTSSHIGIYSKLGKHWDDGQLIFFFFQMSLTIENVSENIDVVRKRTFYDLHMAPSHDHTWSPLRSSRKLS